MHVYIHTHIQQTYIYIDIHTHTHGSGTEAEKDILGVRSTVCKLPGTRDRYETILLLQETVSVSAKKLQSTDT